MKGKGKIIIGLVILVILVTIPLWYSLVVEGSGPPPEVELPVNETECVEGREFMTAHHMDLLDEWRDAVVREGKKDYTSKAYGKIYYMSLTETCLGCHTDRDTFCNRCHDYTDVHPYCFDCHLEPRDK
jgi:hypothetical protein